MQRAFSLVELSIVLVILGLLTGGILAGQSLIRAAELRDVSGSISRYQTAIYAFRDKYFALPGDMANATRFWGDDNAVCPDGAIANGTPGTCNGNGDGKIYAWSDAARSWQHLAMAGLIEGTYPGTGAVSTAGVMPQTKFKNTYINYYWGDIYGSGSTTGGEPNRFYLGMLDAVNGNNIGASMRPEEAWNIDTKFDDGGPASGKLFGFTGTSNSGTCYAGNTYTLSNGGIACFFSYIVN